MAGFKWGTKQTEAALLLAEGLTVQEVAKSLRKGERTIYRWKSNPDFQAEVDRLSLMVGIASRAERLRMAQRVVRQKVSERYALTTKDLLDWLKFAQSETDGVKLDLAALAEAAASVADK